MRGERALAFLREHPWAITPEKLEQISAMVEARLSGELPGEELLAQYAAIDRQTSKRSGVVQVIPVFGTISQRADLLTMASGGTSTEAITRALRMAMTDPEVSAVLLNVDSPGGNVFGVQELADELFALRGGGKPIVALANATAASAAYWIASQADELLVTPSGEVGSIGVLAVHDDVSGMAAQHGIKRTFVSAGTYKAEGNSFEPLGDEARSALQDRVNGYYDTFVKAVARGRGVAQRTVKEGFGQGRIVSAAAAAAEGMVDGIATFDQAVSRLASGRKTVMPRASAAAAALPPPQPDEIAEFRARLAEHA